jgi:hypothetical protein
MKSNLLLAIRSFVRFRNLIQNLIDKKPKLKFIGVSSLQISKFSSLSILAVRVFVQSKHRTLSDLSRFESNRGLDI